MSKPKYKQGRQIRTMSDFENCNSRFFIIHFGERVKTLHRGFVESWQYRLLKNYIYKGNVFIAEKKEVV